MTGQTYLYRARRESTVEGLNSPIAVVMSPSEAYVYVASYGSQAISVFQRDNTGAATRLPELFYRSDLLVNEKVVTGGLSVCVCVSHAFPPGPTNDTNANMDVAARAFVAV